MQRRNLLRLMSAAAALPLLPGSRDAVALARALHTDARREPDLQFLSADQAALVTCISDLIIPRTDTPGASDVGVTRFIDQLLAEWYRPDEIQPLMDGLAGIDRLALQQGRKFVDLDPPSQVALLTTLDGKPGQPGTPEATFARLKSLTVYGYFTSERVMTEVTRVPILPGRFDGCVTR